MMSPIYLIFACQHSEHHMSIDDRLQLNNLFEDWKKNAPGGGALVIRNGEVIYEAYFGMADFDRGEVFSENTISDLGSVSKQFTACLIALVEEDGMLSIEDDIRKFLPEIPFYGDTIRIKHLLWHTSGLKDYEALVMIKEQNYFDHHMSNAVVLELASMQKSPNFPPGTAYEYSNTNYILLTEIIERVSGATLEKYAYERIFKPLAMDQTFFHRNQGKDFENRAIGYVLNNLEFERPLYRSKLVGDGGLYTTLRDLVKWDQNFYQNKLGKGNPSLIDRMTHREPLIDGTHTHMAFAQIFTEHPFGAHSWSHGGSGGGYRSFYIRFPELHFSVAVLSNSVNNNAFEKANQIVQYMLDTTATIQDLSNSDETNASTGFVPVRDHLIGRFSGFYFDQNSLQVVHIYYDDQSSCFMVKWLSNGDDGYAALPIDEHTLAEKEDARYRYHLVNDDTLTHYVGKQIQQSWYRIIPEHLSLQEFSGTYYSEEVQHTVALELDQNHLRSGNPFLDSLIRVGDLTFFNQKEAAILTFIISNQKIDGFSLDAPRGDRSLRNLQFQKIQ